MGTLLRTQSTLVEGVPVLVSRSEGGETCAMANTCTYRGGPLIEGNRDGDVVTCPWHGSQVDLCSGEVLRDLPESPSSASRTECVKGR